MSVAHKESLKICTVCGEIFDANIEGETQHHVASEHPPLLPKYRYGWRAPAKRMIARAA